ncbi:MULTISPECIES: phage tail protein [unclassified Chryseobacterium]|uniref:phage tail protein n=1 Tax=unclassified Chryseobacterium TaxID=2593645 RepID=UPI0030186877
MAKKYADNIASIDTRIADLKAQNSGLINKALDVLKTSVFAIIIEIKNTLTNLLSGVISAIQAIIMDPIGFFKNLIAGVSQGFTNFGTNIWTHLKTGFFGWLTGAMKGISFTMPEDVFSLKGIFSITTQVLGLTWDGIRNIGARVIGEPVMKVLETASEKGLEIIPIVRKDGAAGLWEYLKDQFADLKATVMDAMMDIIQTQVIQAGIKWVMGLMTPVGAFIKAAMAIIDMVKFFIQRAAQIMELVKAFTDSIKAIASGNVSAVAKSIENALGRAVPVLIGFLASLLGIGGLADKILGVIRKIRQRIENAIVKFWNFIKGKAAKLLSKVGIGKLGKKKDKVDEKHIKNMDSEIAPEPFTMNGESHTLTFENGEIYMASEKAPLTYKLTKFKNYVSRKPDADEFGGNGHKILEGIEKLQIRNERVKQDLTNAKKRVESPEKNQKMEEAKAKFDKLSEDIEKFGNDFKLEDLIESSKKTKYKPEKIDFYTSGDKQITIGYHYDVEVNGRNARRFFKSSFKLNKNNLVEQQTIGRGVVTKELGSRSYTDSANQVASNKAIEHLKKNPEEQIEFNASHILADLFLGSGYKSTLNLVIASGHYNKETMKGAENRLKDALIDFEQTYKDINDKNFVTFDIRVTATWKELVDDAITSELAKLNPETDQELLKSMHKILAKNVDPKLVQNVVYEVVKAKLNGIRKVTHNSIRPIEIGADETLQKALK